MTASSVSFRSPSFFAERSEQKTASERTQQPDARNSAESSPSSFRSLLDASAQDEQPETKGTTRPPVATDKTDEQQDDATAGRSANPLARATLAASANNSASQTSPGLSLAALLLLPAGALRNSSPATTASPATAAAPKAAASSEPRAPAKSAVPQHSAAASANPAQSPDANGLTAVDLSGQPATDAVANRSKVETEAPPADDDGDSGVDELKGTQALGLSTVLAPAVTGELSFAMKISGTTFGSQLSATTGHAATDSAAPVMSAAVSGVAGKTSELADHKQSGDGSPTGSFTASDERVSSEAPEAARTDEAAPGSPAAALAEELEKAQAAPARAVHVQIAGEGGQRVDVRLMERSGQLAVAVRSADPALSRALQDNSGELNSNLHAQQYRTELWTPGGHDPADSRGGRSAHSDGGANSSSTEENSGNRQNRNKQPAPQWAQEAEQASATTQKRIEYTWHQ